MQSPADPPCTDARRGAPVLVFQPLDADLANLYDVETKVLLQAVRRNPDRFPKDFLFQLTDQEFENLRSQFVTSNGGGRRYAPYVFIEQGEEMCVPMASD